MRLVSVKYTQMNMSTLNTPTFSGSLKAIDSDDHIPRCVSKLLDKYFEPKKGGMSAILIVSVLPMRHPVQATVLKRLFDNKDYYMSVMTKNAARAHRDARLFRGLARHYLIFLNSVADLNKNLLLLLSLPSWSPNGKMVVMFMIHTASQRELDRSIEFVFQECFLFGIWDVFVVFQRSRNRKYFGILGRRG